MLLQENAFPHNSGLYKHWHNLQAKGDASVRFRSPSRSMSSMTTTNLSSTSKSTSLLMSRGSAHARKIRSEIRETRSSLKSIFNMTCYYDIAYRQRCFARCVELVGKFSIELHNHTNTTAKIWCGFAGLGQCSARKRRLRYSSAARGWASVALSILLTRPGVFFAVDVHAAPLRRNVEDSC